MEPRRYGRLNVFFDIGLEATVHGRQWVYLFFDSFGRLVLLGCDIAVYTPAIYLRRRLQRPLGKSYLGVSFALRCFQRLSNPDLVTQRCSWRNNWYASGQSDTVLSY